MATAAERMGAHRERARRGLRRFTVISADDLRVIAEHGYEGAASTDADQQAKPSVSSSTMAFSKSGRPDHCHRVGRSVRAVQTPVRLAFYHASDNAKDFPL